MRQVILAVLCALVWGAVVSHARICTFNGGQLHVFDSMLNKNGKEMTLEEFADFMGPLWTGHAYCSETDAQKPVLEIIRPVTNGTNITLTIVKDGAAIPATITQRLAKQRALSKAAELAPRKKLHDLTPAMREAQRAAAAKRVKPPRFLDVKTEVRSRGFPDNRRQPGYHPASDSVQLARRNWFEDRWNDIKNVAKDVGNGIKDFVTDPIGTVKKAIVGGAVNMAEGAISAACDVHKIMKTVCDSVNDRIQADGECRQDIKDAKGQMRRSLDELREVMENPRRRVFRRRENPNDPFQTCLALVSKHPSANPYHDLLTGMKQANLRRGGAYPIRDGDNQACPSTNKGPCTYTKATEKTTTTVKSFTVTSADAKTYSKGNSQSWGQAKEQSETKAVTDILEKNWSKTKSREDTQTLADETSRTLTKTHEDSVADTHTVSNERSTADATTWNRDDTTGWSEEDGTDWSQTDETNWQDNHNQETNYNNALEERQDTTVGCNSGGTVGGQAGIDIKLASGQISGSVATDRSTSKTKGNSNTQSKGGSMSIGGFKGGSTSNARGGHHTAGRSGGTTVSRGGSQTVTVGHTESDSRETRSSDTTADAFTHGVTKTKGWTIGSTDANGGSQSHQIGTTSTLGVTDNTGKEIRTDESNQSTKGWDNTTSISTTLTQTQTVGRTFDAGKCVYSVCMPAVTSVVVPFACRDAKGEIQILTSEVQELDLDEKGQPICNAGLQSCYGDKAAFTLLDDDHGVAQTLEATNVIRVNQIISPPSSLKPILVSENQRYTSGFLPARDPRSFGSSFYVKDGDTIIWETGLHNFGGRSAEDDENSIMETRIRITPYGHFVQEAKNILMKNRNLGDWMTVWSSVPGHLNYTVGVWGTTEGYTIVLQNNGKLVLRDGVGAKIWSSAPEECAHAYGYKYPDEYRFPLGYDEPEPNFPGQSDPHNDLPANIEWTGDTVWPFTCNSEEGRINSTLSQMQGIRSPNGRFSLYLSSTGNLILKDYYRTMWASNTADLWFTEPSSTYHLFVSPIGQITIRDDRKRLIWSTLNNIDTEAYPYFLSIYDGGDAIVSNRNRTMVWQTWPMRVGNWTEEKPLINNLEVHYPVARTQCFKECGECKNEVDASEAKPFKNLATNLCLGPNGTSPCTGAPEQQWIFDSTFSLIRWAKNTSMCVGHNATVLGPCDVERGWSFYPDGSMNMIYRPYTCLYPDGRSRPCDNPRFDKRWSFGQRTIRTLETNGSTIMLSGEQMVDPKSKATFMLFPNGDLQLKSPKKPGLPTTRRLSENGLKLLKKNGPPAFQVGLDGSVKIVNLLGNILYEQLALPDKEIVGAIGRENEYYIGLKFNPDGTKIMYRPERRASSVWSFGYPGSFA
ncbi:hypothetical protein HDU88_000006 [Geranomyces variabilis]|nr:hypothetical protein HDU88_000006 [Geranomyces variabilis]